MERVEERRKFERVNLAESSGVYATDQHRRRLGAVRQIGRGGLLIDTAHSFADLSTHTVRIVDESEGIDRSLLVITRYTSPTGVGFEFADLGADAAVEIGILIGKYYQEA